MLTFCFVFLLSPFPGLSHSKHGSRYRNFEEKVNHKPLSYIIRECFAIDLILTGV